MKFTQEDIDVIEAIWPRSDVEKEETVPGVAIIRRRLEEEGCTLDPKRVCDRLRTYQKTYRRRN